MAIPMHTFDPLTIVRVDRYGKPAEVCEFFGVEYRFDYHEVFNKEPQTDILLAYRNASFCFRRLGWVPVIEINTMRVVRLGALE